MILRSLVCLAILFGTALRGAAITRTFPVVAGAPGADATAAAQAALDACAAAGGGTVLFSAGTWSLDQPALVRSGTTVRLQANARIVGNLLFENAERVALVGDDRATSFVKIARFSDCKDVVVSDVSGEAQWFTRCTGVRLDRITLAQKPQRQGEGSAIGFTSCRDVRAADCDFSSNDDVWCLKRGGEDIHLTRSILRGHLAAPFKIGTETDGLFRRITFTDSVVIDSDRAAITIEAVDGATVEDVTCERLRFINVNTPLFIRLGNRDRYNLRRVGAIRDIVLRDIESTGGGKDEGFGSSIAGLPGHAIERVTLERVRILVRGGGRPEDAEDPVPERPEFYPEFDLFGRLPAYGLYARHVRGLTLRDVSLGFATPDTRPALVCDDVAELTLDRFRPMGLAESVSVIREIESRRRYQPGLSLPPGSVSVRLIDTHGVTVTRSSAGAGVRFVEVGGVRSGGIRLEANLLVGATAPAFLAGPEVPGPLPPEFSRGSVPLPRVVTPPTVLPAGDVSWLVSVLATARPGEVIAVPPGHYRVTEEYLPLTIASAGLTVRPAEGLGTVRIEAVPRLSEDVQRIFRNATPAELARLALFRIQAADVTLEGLTLGGAAFNVFAHGVDRLTVRNNAFDFSRLFHIHLLEGRGHRIQGNRARASLNCVARFERCPELLIEENHLAENPAGFRLESSPHAVIRRNRLLGLSWDAILLADGSDDARIEENEIVDGRLTGIQVRASHRARIVGNRLAGHKTEAVLVDRGSSGLVLRRNQFLNNTGFAVSNETAHVIDARENGWGSPTGPSRDGRGQGDLVDDRVDFADWLR